MYKLLYDIKTRYVNERGVLYRLLGKILAAVLSVYLNTVQVLLYRCKFLIKKRQLKSGEIPAVVSLTSFPNRINCVWKTIASILDQNIRPENIILWLSKGQFNSKEDLPIELRCLEKFGYLTIRFVDNDIKSFKKFYYMLKEFPEKDFITIDDDVFYPKFTLEKLWQLHTLYPEDVCCMSGIEIIDINSKPSEWHGNPQKELLHIPHLRIIGVGGVYYPHGSLYIDATNFELAKVLCPWADDLWLTMMALLQGTYISKYSVHCNPIEVYGSQTVTLSNENRKIDFAKRITNDQQWINLVQFYAERLISVTK